MPNYQNSKIYKIVSDHTDEIYIGSTCTKKGLSKRMGNHKYDYNNGYNGTSSKEILKYDDAKIVLIELYPCNSKEELYARERHYIETTNCVNKHIPSRTKKEWVEDNKKHIKNYKKQHYQDNKDILSQKGKEYRLQNQDKIKEKFNCECGGKYKHSCRSIHFKTKKHIDFMKSKTHLPTPSTPQ